MRLMGWTGVTLLLLGWLVGCAVGKASVPYGFVDRRVAGGLQLPTDFVFFPDGDESRFLVAEKGGVVKMVRNGRVQPGSVLDISRLVNSYLDRALLSILIDVDFFRGKRYIYLSYALDTSDALEGPKTGRIARVTLNNDGSTAIAGSTKVILGTVEAEGCAGQNLSRDIICCDAPTHCMGALAQEKNGIIWVTIGDGAVPQVTTDGHALRSQAPNFLNGKVLRITRSGLGARDNPRFGGDGSENRHKIWSYGLRNGWRAHVDPVTKGLLVADVGWATYESIKLATKSSNQGWPCFQALQKNSAYSIYRMCGRSFPTVGIKKDPVEYYGRTKGISVSSVLRLQFSSWPAEYRNKVFYTDYGFSLMNFFGMDSNGKLTEESQPFAGDLAGPVQVRAGSNDKLYYLSLSGQEVRVISYEPDLTPPKIVSIYPPGNSIRIEMSVTIEIGMSKLVDEESIVGAVELTKVATGARIYGQTWQDRVSRFIRFRPNRELDANTRYKVSVAGLKDPDGKLLSNPRTFDFTTGTGRTRYVSDLYFRKQGNFFGPLEKDQSNGKEFRNDGLPLEIRGVPFEKGLGGIPPSFVTVALPAGCKRFQATVGIDDSALDLEGPKAFFEVERDRKTIYDSRDVHPAPLTRVSGSLDIDVDVSGARTVTLRAINGGNPRKKSNLIAWGGARFRCGDFDGVQPRVWKTIPANGAKSVSTTPSITIRFSEPMDPRFFLSAVRLRRGSQEVGWTPQVNTAATELTMLLEELKYSTEYVLSVSTEARDRVGNRLRAAFQSSFKTRLPPPTGSIISLLELIPTKREGSGSVEFRNGPVNAIDPWTVLEWKGLGVKPWSMLEYTVPRHCSGVQARAGVDAASSHQAECEMRIRGGTSGKSLFRETLRYAREPANVNVDVSGEETIILNARMARAGMRTFCNWASIQLVCHGGNRIQLSSRTPISAEGIMEKNLNALRARMSFATGTGESTRTYANGILARPLRKLTYHVPWRCSRLRASYGLHPSSGPQASLMWMVNGNDFPMCMTRKFVRGTKPQDMSCFIRGEEVSVSVESGGDTTSGDVGVMGLPELDCAVGSRKPQVFIDPLPRNFVIGDKIPFSGYALDFKGKPLPKRKLIWSVTQHHCATLCHFHSLFQLEGERQGSVKVEPHGDYFYYEVTLRACDGPEVGIANCAQTSSSVYPKAADLTLDSEPSGLMLGVDSVNGQGPLTQTVVVGSIVELSAIRVQGPHRFLKWEHDESKEPVTTVRITSTEPRSFKALFRTT